jgi:thiosulfate dehydrogenase [quinone] large subunit
VATTRTSASDGGGRVPLGLDERLPGWPLALFRIAFGLLYLDMALQKAPWIGYGWLRGFIEQEIAHPAFGWYAAFLQDVVLPNFGLFGLQTFVIELLLGLGLLLGLLTRLAAAAGFLWQVNIALGAFNVPGEWYWIWPLLTLPLFTFAVAGAGRVLGLDRWLTPVLERRARRGQTWARVLRLAL